MTDCANPMMRDQLPDFLAGALPAPEARAVVQHVAECETCEAELALLREVRAMRAEAPALDLAAIVAALPPAPGATRGGVGGSGTAPALTVMSGGLDQRGNRAGRPAMAPPVATRRRIHGPSWGMRAAAAVGVILAGAFATQIAVRGPVAITAADSVARPVATTQPADVVADATGATSPASMADVRDATDAVTTVAAATVAPAVLPVGELADLSDAELEVFMAELDAWDGATSVEPVSRVMPTMPPSGAGSTDGTGATR